MESKKELTNNLTEREKQVSAYVKSLTTFFNRLKEKN